MKNCILFSVLSLILFTCFSCENLVPGAGGSASDSATNDLFLLDKSLNKNNQILTHTSSSLIESMKETVRTKVQYQPLADEAQEATGLGKDFFAYIDELRDLLVRESGGVYSQEEAARQNSPELAGMPKKATDKDTPARIFISGNENKEPQGEVLDKKIQELKEAYLNHVSKLWDNGGVIGTIFADPGKKENELKQLEEELTLSSSENYNPAGHEGKSWTESSFEKKSVAMIYLMLRKFQNDARMSELTVINFLASQMGKLELNYDMFDVFAQSPKPAIRLGETFESEIALGAYSSQAQFAVSVNGSSLKIQDGKALYQSKPSSVGPQKYTAKISVMNPLTGETESFTKDFYYEVIKE